MVTVRLETLHVIPDTELPEMLTSRQDADAIYELVYSAGKIIVAVSVVASGVVAYAVVDKVASYCLSRVNEYAVTVDIVWSVRDTLVAV